ncbi:MAG: hypothetical protein RBS28_02340 [Rhodocyclaceae bacterium]|jgi:hypothetical protein|nr:hypothetical protein [Rhodocyclaceae bacterium]
MNILFHVTTPGGGALLAPLALAAGRKGAGFAAFFTHEGVLGLKDPALLAALAGAERAVVCEESWHRFCPGIDCPVEHGSQTTNSALMAEAERVVAL